MAKRRTIRARREPFPWILFLAVIGSVYLFWFSPKAKHTKPATIEFKSP